MRKRPRPCWPMIGVFALMAAAMIATYVGCSTGGGSTKPSGGYDPPPPPPTPHYLFEDSFDGPQLDSSIWVRHGSGVSLADGLLRIESGVPWESGIEAADQFFCPIEGDRLTVAGTVHTPDDTSRSVALVYLQDHWRADDPDCYVLRFGMNQEQPGDNDIEFRVKIDGAWVEQVWLGGFDVGDVISWEFTIYPSHCTIEVGDRVHSTDVSVYDLGLSLHGSGAATYWGSVAVILWDVHY
jgi:hypothetical protein